MEDSDGVADLLQVSLSSVKRWKKPFRKAVCGFGSKRHPGLVPNSHRRNNGGCGRSCSTDQSGRRVLHRLVDCRRVAEVVAESLNVCTTPTIWGAYCICWASVRRSRNGGHAMRDEQAIQRWRKHDWAADQKKGRRRQAVIVFSTKPASCCSP